MPAAKPLEFRRRAVDLARAGDQPVAKIAKDLGISATDWFAGASDCPPGRRSPRPGGPSGGPASG